MLLGRAPECQAVEDLLAAAREGRSGSLAVVGEVGIGKTALLDWAADRAGGMRVLRARGIESEAHVPFAGLFELLRPALDWIDRIPAPQAEPLAGALALRPARGGERFAIGAATLSLLAAYAEDEPVAVFVDDAHWLDGSSADALLFAVRRLVADPIAIVMGVRDGLPSLLDSSDIPRLRLEGLDAASTAELLAREAGESLRDGVAARAHRSTGGNPLALVELAHDPSALDDTPLDSPLPVGVRIAREFLRRYGALPEDTRTCLLVAAASDRGDMPTIARAAASLGVEVSALEPAEAAGLVRLGAGTVDFTHPLVRAAIYGHAQPDKRRATHRALASALPDMDLDRRAWHLDLGSVGPDQATSSALEQAGIRARDRSAYAVAVSAFERAARLTVDDGRRAQLLFEAADAAWVAALAQRTVELLDEASDLAPDDALRARIDNLRGDVAVRRGRVMEGHAILLRAAERASDDPERAVIMLAEAAEACFFAGDAREMVKTAERALARVPPDAQMRTRFFAALAHGEALIFSGEDAERGAALIRDAVHGMSWSDDWIDEPRLLAWAAMAPAWLREGDVGHRLVDRAVASARDRATIGALPLLLAHVAIGYVAADDWSAGRATYDEAMRLAREAGQRTELAGCLARRAWLEARQGKEDEARAHVAEARALAAELNLGLVELWALQALGDLELGLGRPAAAVEHFEELERHLEAHGIGDVDVSPAPELVDAYLRLGRRDDAVAAATSLTERARAKGQPWALARAARANGLVADDPIFVEPFEEALRLHEQTPDLFETGRTRLAYGSRLRRARQRVRARAELRAAIEAFDRLGATPWLDLAAAELAATGETARRRDPSTRDELTPQELQICLLLAEGKTTREAAAALFLSPKTIEYHLRNAYRKLGISSREELAVAVGRS